MRAEHIGLAVQRMKSSLLREQFFPSRNSWTSYIVSVPYFCCSKGILAGAQLTLPKDCKNNKFCEITKMILGPTVKFYIYGNFEWKKVKVAVGFAHIRIWDGLYFDKLELYVEVSLSCPLFRPCLRTQFSFCFRWLFEATWKKSECSLEVELTVVSVDSLATERHFKRNLGIRAWDWLVV